eukprot:389040-Pyramimonas_sp.AAC.1
MNPSRSFWNALRACWNALRRPPLPRHPPEPRDLGDSRSILARCYPRPGFAPPPDGSPRAPAWRLGS